MPPFNICPENPQKNLVTYISKERVSDSVRAIFTFTFRIVEAIKQTKIQAPPSQMTLPFSVSVAAGLIVLMLSFTVEYSPLYPIGQLIGSALPSQTQVADDGVIPVDTIEITKIVSLSPEMADGDFGKKPMPEPMNFLGGGGKWERKTDMPTARYALSTAGVELNGKIYVIGGWNGQALSTVEEYDPATDTWRKRADMPTPRCALATVVVDGKIFHIPSNYVVNFSNH